MKISELGGEAALINLIRDSFGTTGAGDLELGIGDDAALIRAGDKLVIVTTDLLVERTHFRMDINEAYLLGWKSAAVNISDIAAMGGSPTYSFVSIGLPDVEVSEVEAIYRGMRDMSARYGSLIAGGDTVGSDCGIVINVVQLGVVEPDRVVKRSGAKPGDLILVTNTLGDSRAGLELLLKYGLDEARRVCEGAVERHLKPEPRVNEGRALAATGKIRSMMDLSDGLSSDLKKLCEASNVGARVNAEQMPISADLPHAAEQLGADAAKLAISGGEDYELLFTSAREDVDAVIDAVATAESSATVIGEIVAEPGVVLVSSNGKQEPMPESWQHF